MAICQKGVALNRVEAGRGGGNSVCTSWIKGEVSFTEGDLEDKRNCRHSATQTKVIEGTWAITQQQPRSSMLVCGRKLRVRGTARGRERRVQTEKNFSHLSHDTMPLISRPFPRRPHFNL